MAVHWLYWIIGWPSLQVPKLYHKSRAAFELSTFLLYCIFLSPPYCCSHIILRRGGGTRFYVDMNSGIMTAGTQYFRDMNTWIMTAGTRYFRDMNTWIMTAGTRY